MTVDSIISLDELDYQIIEVLQGDGRMPIQQISNQLNASASTIRKRIQRLQDANVMKIVAVTDFSSAGYELLLAIGIQVEHRNVEQVGNELAQLPEVFSVNLTTGTYDLEILVAAKNFDELSFFMYEELPTIKGIAKLEPGLTVDVLRYESGWVNDL